MKTPREIFFARHHGAGPKLAAIRQAVVTAELNHQATKEQSDDRMAWWLRLATTPWRELVLPSRRIWTGLGAVWLLLAIINVSQRDTVSSVTGQPARSPAVMMSWQTQQRWMNELLADRSMPPEVDRPKNNVPKPRTEYDGIMAA